MDALQARKIIADYIKKTFGQAAELRDVSVERSSSGRIWVGNVYCVTARGDVYIGGIGVSEEGQVSRPLGPDALIDALLAVGSQGAFKEEDISLEQDFSLLSQEMSAALSEEDEENDIELFFSEFNSAKLMGTVIGLLTSGDKEDLLKARRVMPQLLADHENRATVLRCMGELEIRLGEMRLGAEYLEAAAREFADIGDVESLKKTAALAVRISKDAAWDASSVTRLLEQTAARLVPVESLLDASAFSGLDDSAKRRLAGLASSEHFAQGDIVLEEGAPATRAYVIQSGILGVSLETPDGEKRTVRCCFPGELVGESCIQDGATCNATVFAQKPCVLWRIDGAELKAAASKIKNLRAGLDNGRTIHQLDSFFSMNNATSSLDVRVRDRLLGCITAIRHVRKGEILERKGELPSAVYLVLSGALEYRPSGAAPRMYAPDSFACIRDTLHKLPLEGEMAVIRPGRLITFDPNALFDLALAAPPEVTAVLERLE
jgi:CRP-like cAMP-binding protein